MLLNKQINVCRNLILGIFFVFQPWIRQENEMVFLDPTIDESRRRSSHCYHLHQTPSNSQNGKSGSSNGAKFKEASNDQHHHQHQKSSHSSKNSKKCCSGMDSYLLQKQRRHSFNDMDVPAPPPPPHATNVWNGSLF